MAMPDTVVMFSVKLPIEIVKRKKWYLASCRVLDVHSQGETEYRAKKNLKEALTLFLTSCFERGTLDEVLKECGFTPYTAPEKLHVPKHNYINVSLPMLIDESKSCGYHA
jgi:predicted RNase H-like HicB family nuclease